MEQARLSCPGGCAVSEPQHPSQSQHCERMNVRRRHALLMRAVATHGNEKAESAPIVSGASKLVTHHRERAYW
jgi:hypothetical protein